MLLFTDTGETEPISVSSQWSKWDKELSSNPVTSSQTGSQQTGSTMSISPYGSTTYGSQPVVSGGGGSSSRITPSYMQPLVTGRTSTTSYTAGKALPTFTAPTYTTPTYDYGRVNYLAQQQAAPQYNKLAQGLYTGIGKIAATDNPYMQAQARKNLLAGYGAGVSEVASGAARTGAQLYNTEYQGKLQEAQMNYQGQMATAQALFEAAMQDWQKSLTTTTTESNIYNNQGTSTATSGMTPFELMTYNPDSWRAGTSQKIAFSRW